MSDRLRQALKIQAKQERIARRLQLINTISERYMRLGRAHQRDLDTLIEAMPPQDLAMYRATLAIERGRKK